MKSVLWVWQKERTKKKVSEKVGYREASPEYIQYTLGCTAMQDFRNA